MFAVLVCGYVFFKTRNGDMPQLMLFGYYSLSTDENDDSIKIVSVPTVLFWCRWRWMDEVEGLKKGMETRV